MKPILALIAAACWLAAGTVAVTPAQQQTLGITTATPVTADHAEYGPFNGIVTVAPNDNVVVSNQTNALVTSLYVADFDRVKKGDKIMTIKSSELLSLQNEYLQALWVYENAQATFMRHVALAQEGIIAEKTLLESTQNANSAQSRLNIQKQLLLLSGLSEAMIDELIKNKHPLEHLDILSPDSGLIAALHVKPGERVEADSPLVTLIKDGPRYLEIAVPAHLSALLSINDHCSFAGTGGAVVSISQIVQSASQTIVVRAKIDDASRVQINRNYDVSLSLHVNDAWRIPRNAIVHIGGKPLVFVATHKGFRTVAIDVLFEEAAHFIVRAPFTANDKLVVSGTAALISALGGADE